jgi:recombination protein RecA
MIKEAQKKGLKCVFVDAENALNFDFAAKLGVDLDKLTVVHGTYGEEYIDDIEEIIESSKVDLIVVDSVDALTPKSETDSSIEQQHIGTQAKLMGRFCRRIIEPIRKKKIAMVLINQIRNDVMMGYEFTPGGKAMQFYKSVQVKLKQTDAIKQGERVVGIKIKAKISKNKVGKPYGEIDTQLIFDEGFSEEASILETAIMAELVTRVGNTLYFGGESGVKLGVGMGKARQYLIENPELFKEIKSKL